MQKNGAKIRRSLFRGSLDENWYSHSDWKRSENEPDHIGALGRMIQMPSFLLS